MLSHTLSPAQVHGICLNQVNLALMEMAEQLHVRNTATICCQSYRQDGTASGAVCMMHIVLRKLETGTSSVLLHQYGSLQCVSAVHVCFIVYRNISQALSLGDAAQHVHSQHLSG